MQPLRPVEKVVVGNPEVVKFLEGWLDKAKHGNMDFCGIVACEGPINVLSSCCGVRESYFAGYFGANCLASQIYDTLQKGPNAEEDMTHIPANEVVFDITNGPTNFDVISWLIYAEMQRRKEGYPSPLKVAFVQFPKKTVSSVQQPGHFENIVVPAVRMVGAEIDESASSGRNYKTYSMVHLVNDAKMGISVPKLQPIKWSFPWKDFITITLREASYYDHRNSNLEEWIKFANYLKALGETVIFVRDTSKADQAIEGFTICPEASKELNIRLSLYEQAKCNLFVSNGPWMLALFGSAPWLMFNQTDQMDPFWPNTPVWWRKNHGVPVGEQFPWSTPQQRIIWKTDNFENMKQAWEEFNASRQTNGLLQNT